MVVTLTSPTRNIRALVSYVLEGHNGKGAKRAGGSRVLNTTTLGNFKEGDVGDFKRSVTKHLEAVGKLNPRNVPKEAKKVEGRSIILSWDKSELNPESSWEVDKALDISRTLVERLYPGHQALIVAQDDGKGGNLHTHIVVCNAHNVTGNAVEGRNTKHSVMKRVVDQIHRESDVRNKNAERDERERQVHGRALSPTERDIKGKRQATPKLTTAIDTVLESGVKTWEAFEIGLTSKGVGIRLRNSKAEGSEDGKMLTYFIKEQGSKQYARRHTTLGEGYSKASIMERLEANRQAQEARMQAENARWIEARMAEEARGTEEARIEAERAQAQAAREYEEWVKVEREAQGGLDAGATGKVAGEASDLLGASESVETFRPIQEEVEASKTAPASSQSLSETDKAQEEEEARRARQRLMDELLREALEQEERDQAEESKRLAKEMGLKEPDYKATARQRDRDVKAYYASTSRYGGGSDRGKDYGPEL